LRIAYLGTSQFAADVLDILSALSHRPELVVTRPDRPRGRGRKLASPPVLSVAHGLGIDTDQPESVNDEAARARIAAAAPDAVVVCAFGALIKEPLLSDYPLLNVHPSLLPRWRGAAPIERAIMAGDERTGVSIMRLTAGLDTGPVCLAADEPIGRTETYGTLAGRLASLGARLLVEALETSPPFHEQDEAAATYAEKITAEDRVLNTVPARPAIELERVVRALSPHIGAVVVGVGGDRSERLGVWGATARPAQPGDPPPGELGLNPPVPTLGCTPGTLALTTVQPAGRRQMPGNAYLRGLRS
jgi:methionyl-tRNA formyltransferase